MRELAGSSKWRWYSRTWLDHNVRLQANPDVWKRKPDDYGIGVVFAQVRPASAAAPPTAWDGSIIVRHRPDDDMGDTCWRVCVRACERVCLRACS
jgi:hypothetical protein